MPMAVAFSLLPGAGAKSRVTPDDGSNAGRGIEQQMQPYLGCKRLLGGFERHDHGGYKTNNREPANDLSQSRMETHISAPLLADEGMSEASR